VKHRKQVQPASLAPLVVAGAVLTFGWAPLATAHTLAEDMTQPMTGPVLRTSDLKRATREPQRSSVATLALRAALTRLGKPYVWGAKGPDAVDCSGLVQWSYKQVGVQLGPDTYTQINQGVAVRDTVQPGDLIFPLAAFSSRGPGHVQLALDSTHVVEAPGRGLTVRVTTMPTKYEARRIP